MRVVWLAVLALLVIVDGTEFSVDTEHPAAGVSSQAASEIESLYQELMAMPQSQAHHTALQVPEDELIEVPSGTLAAPVSAAEPLAATQPTVAQKAQPQPVQPRTAPQQTATQQTPQELKQRAQKAAATKKLHQAQDFNQLVKNVNSILGRAILEMKRDRKLFLKAQSDTDRKEHAITEAAEQAKQEAKNDAIRIAAIETHVSLAQQDNAKATIAFATKFRRTATHTFWKSYNKAKRLKSQLNELYDSITSHVGRAVNAMRRKRGPLEKGFLKHLKAYFKVRYGGCGGKDSKQDCTKLKRAAKNKMKEARATLISFKTNLKTAHHHGKKLRHRLHSAIAKLHFVFKQARQEERKSEADFHAGFDARYSARKTVSLAALKKVKQRVEKKTTSSKVQPKSQSKSDTVNTVATALVKEAAKAITNKKEARPSARVTVATNTEQPVAHASKKAQNKAVEMNAEKKVVNLLKKVVKQATTTMLKQQPDDQVPPKMAPSRT